MNTVSCVRCVMDTTDPDIRFDDQGVCNHCTEFVQHAKIFPQTAEEKARKLRALVSQIQREGQGKKYDCIIGLSGGVDSTYVALQVKKLGLRPLAVHFDNSWNSELAVKNIENIVKKLGIDLYTYVMDWPEFRDIQLAFLKASVRDCEIPTDHAIVAVLLRVARENRVRYILSGNNHATEGVLPVSYSYGCFDWKYIKSIHRRFGKKRLRKFPHFSFWSRLRTVFIHRVKNIGLLNYLDYDKPKAMKVIQDELEWKNYGGKHHESIYTRFFQGYLLPTKFGIDKRKAHYSALILSGQMTRAEALEALSQQPYSPQLMQEDRAYVAKKFGLSEGELDKLLTAPNKYFTDYPTYYPMLERTRWMVRLARRWGVLPQRVGI